VTIKPGLLLLYYDVWMIVFKLSKSSTYVFIEFMFQKDFVMATCLPKMCISLTEQRFRFYDLIFVNESFVMFHLQTRHMFCLGLEPTVMMV
jgi:hypothetical protein